MICFEKAIQVTSLRRYNNLCQVGAFVQDGPPPKHQRVEVILRQTSFYGLDLQKPQKNGTMHPKHLSIKKVTDSIFNCCDAEKSH